MLGREASQYDSLFGLGSIRLDQSTSGTKFWFQGMRNCYLAVGERDLLLPFSLSSRLLSRSPTGGFATGHPGDWTTEQLREPAQRVADRIEALMNGGENNDFTANSADAVPNDR